MITLTLHKTFFSFSFSGIIWVLRAPWLFGYNTRMHPLYTYAAGNAITFRSDKVVSETEGLGSREQAIWRWKPVLAALWMAYLLDAGALARTLPISVGLKR